jgi:hypothetical protein
MSKLTVTSIDTPSNITSLTLSSANTLAGKFVISSSSTDSTFQGNTALAFYVTEQTVGPSVGLKANTTTVSVGPINGYPFVFLMNNGEVGRFAANGNLGIATTAPSEKLNVAGNILAAGNITASSNVIAFGNFTVGGSAVGGITVLTDGATITPDFYVRNNFSVTLAGNRTLANPSNPTAGQSGIIYVTQDGTGSRTLSYGSYWKFPAGTAPTLTTTANAVDALVYTVRSATSITVNSVLNIG